MIAPPATSHHILNSIAVGVPVMSWIVDAQPVLTALLTAMGIGWYIILYLKEWRRK